MTQTQNTPAPSIAWRQAMQLKLMAALDAVWAILEHSDDPAEIREARNRAKAVGDLAGMIRKVAMIVPIPRAAPAQTFPFDVGALAPAPVAAPVAAQAEQARRALEKLKGGGRARL